MHRYFILVLLLLPFINGVAQQTKGIEFSSTSWSQTVDQAVKKDLPIFLFAYTNACRYCKQMEREVFTDPEVAAFYNSTFLSYKIDVDDGGPGEALAERLGVYGFPTYVYITPRGRKLHQSGSGKPAAAFIEDGRNALDPDRALFSLASRYEAGDRTPDLLYNYANALTFYHQRDSPESAVVSDYMATQSMEQLASKKNLIFLFSKNLPISSPATQYFLAHHKTFLTVYSPNEIDAKVKHTVLRAATNAGQEGDSLQLHALQSTIRRHFSDTSFLLPLSEIYFLNGKRDWLPYAKATLAYAQNRGRYDVSTLTETVTYLQYFAEEQEVYEVGATIMDLVVKAERSYDNLVQRAEILHLSGEVDLAIKAAREAIQRSAASGSSDDTAQDLVKKWESEK